MTADLDRFLGWLRDAAAEPVPAKLVPGASELERRRLGALGGLVRHLAPERERAAWPTGVIDWLEAGPAPPEHVVSAARQVIARHPDDSLAALYGKLVSAVNRRALGTFFTPLPEVKLMLDMWQSAEQTPSTVVDVGAGVGVFTVSAARRWPQAQVIGVDINPVTLGLLALRDWLDGLPSNRASSTRPKICLVCEDFTTWITEAWNKTNSPRLILGNPPYTRWQLLSVEDRVRLVQAASGFCDARSSLSTLITAISLRHLSRSDGLCLLLPAQWLESHYAAPLRNRLAQMTQRKIELRLVESKLFPDAQVDAVALLVGQKRDRNQSFSIATWAAETVIPVERDYLVGKPWRALFRDAAKNTFTPIGTSPPTLNSALSQFCVVRRGIATGANSFFVLSDIEIAKCRLSHGVCLKLIRRLRPLPDLVDDVTFDSLSHYEKRWLLNISRSNRRKGSAVDRYLKIGEENEIQNRYLCQSRDVWYDLSQDIVTPDVIVSPMTRGHVRFVENDVRAVITNNLYGWCWKAEVPDPDRAAILDWLRSEPGQATVLAAARQQGEGLRKIEPRALANIMIPMSVAQPPQPSLYAANLG